MASNVFKNLTGRTFGRLKVLWRLPNRSGGASWWCRCKCGVEKEVTANHLLNGTRSCGCLMRDTNGRRCRTTLREYNQLRPFEWIYNNLVHTAKTRGLLVLVTFEDFLNLLKIPICVYCGDSVVWHPYSNHHQTATNIDRKDNTTGYTKENCVICCHRCNCMKSNFPVEDFLLHCEKIAKKWRDSE